MSIRSLVPQGRSQASRRIVLLLLSMVVLSSCNKQLIAQVEQLKKRVEILEQDRDSQAKELSGAWSILFCGEKIRQFLADVNRECSADAQDAGSTCSTKDIEPAVRGLDERGLFLTLMRPAKSVLFPVGLGATELSQYRIGQLDGIIQARFRATRYLIVARATQKESPNQMPAKRRGDLVRTQLMNFGIPQNAIVGPWVYNFQMSKEERMQYKRQLYIGEPGEVDLGVWVFRVDC